MWHIWYIWEVKEPKTEKLESSNFVQMHITIMKFGGHTVSRTQFTEL